MGNLVFQATLGGQVNLVGPNTASTYNLNVPAVAGTLVTTGDTGTVTNTMLSGPVSIANGGTNNSSFTAKSGNVAGLVFYDGTKLANDATVTDIGYDTSSNKLTTGNDASISGLTVGKGAGAVSTNTAVGASALAANTSGPSNTATGYGALAANTTGGYNTANGVNALTANTSGASNSAFGIAALNGNTTGGNNVAVGTQALQANTTASSNTAVGYQAGYTNTIAPGNVFIGYQAGYSSNVAGGVNGYNVCVGTSAGYNLTTGYGNTFVGGTANYPSGYYVTTGAKNTILGAYNGNQGGLNITTSSNYIVLSDGDGNPRLTFNGSGQGFIGATSGVASGYFGVAYNGGTYNGLGLNDTNNTTGAGFIYFQANGTTIGSINRVGSGSTINYATSSDYRLKENVQPMQGALARVALLKPVTYTWKDGGDEAEGFIAHELAEVCPHAVVGEKDAVNEDGSIKPQGIDTSFLVATLTAAIQELNAKVEAQAAEIAALKGQA